MLAFNKNSYDQHLMILAILQDKYNEIHNY